MTSRYIRFEYDLNFHGGDYDQVGRFALVPRELCDRLGDEAAFEKHTGIDKVHVVHHSPDDLYDAEGEWVEE